jgi:archaellum biogenesis ATPase FlaH
VKVKESVCEVRTQDPENFDEEVLALVSAWCNALLTLHLQAYGQGELCSPALSPSCSYVGMTVSVIQLLTYMVR